MQFADGDVRRICDYFCESPFRRGAPLEEIDTSQGRSGSVLPSRFRVNVYRDDSVLGDAPFSQWRDERARPNAWV